MYDWGLVARGDDPRIFAQLRKFDGTARRESVCGRKHDNAGFGVERLVPQLRIGRFGKKAHEPDVGRAGKNTENLLILREETQTDTELRRLDSGQFQHVVQNAIFGNRAAGDVEPSQKSRRGSAGVLEGCGGLTDGGSGAVEKCGSGLR